MTHYNTLNVKSSESQLSKPKTEIKNGTEVTLNLLSNVVSDSNDETNFLHKVILTNSQISKIHKAFANGLLANIKLPRTQLSKMVQLRGFIMDQPLGFLGITSLFKTTDSIVNPVFESMKKRCS